jgi:hypothetical protein
MKLFHGAAIAAVALAMSGVAMAEGASSKAVQLTDAQMASKAAGYDVITSRRGQIYQSEVGSTPAWRIDTEGRRRTATSTY